jgi:hypothetical protein
MELSITRESTSSEAIRWFPIILWNPEVHNRIPKSSPLHSYALIYFCCSYADRIIIALISFVSALILHYAYLCYIFSCFYACPVPGWKFYCIDSLILSIVFLSCMMDNVQKNTVILFIHHRQKYYIVVCFYLDFSLSSP